MQTFLKGINGLTIVLGTGVIFRAGIGLREDYIHWRSTGKKFNFKGMVNYYKTKIKGVEENDK